METDDHVFYFLASFPEIRFPAPRAHADLPADAAQEKGSAAALA
jgi:hypothetical protein